MKNLRVWQKLAVLGVLFLIPFAVVTYEMVATTNRAIIEFARQEIRGVEYIDRLLTVLHKVQDHRDLAALAAASDHAKGDLQANTSEIEKAIQAVDEVNGRLGAALKAQERWSGLRKEVADFSRNPSNEGDRGIKLVAEIIALINHVGDISNLTLDPDLDTYYLMNIHQFEAPKLAERLSQARLMGVALATGASPEKQEQLQRDGILAEFHLGSTDGSFEKAWGATSELHPRLEPVQKVHNVEVVGSLKTIQASTTVRESMGSTTFYQNVSQGLNAIYKMETEVSSALVDLIKVRIGKAEKSVYHTLLYAFLGLLVVLIIGVFIMRDISRPLNHVVAIANEIATGNLSVQTSMGQRRDEIGDLSRSFDRMVGVLRSMAQAVKEIASGNLTVQVKSQSKEDAMGNALSEMVTQLSTLTGQIQKSGSQVTTSIQDIAATSKEQQATASEIAATTTEIGATSKEISATSRELAKTMGEVAKVAEGTATLAGSSQEAVTRMEDTMRHISEAAASINAKLNVLSEKAGNINQVVTTITKVADQTNLLSLNAAIEAEKAGEYGRGFAVVATEIRRLADQTAVATYDIEQIVKEMQSAVSAGVMGMDKFSEEVRRGVSEVHQVSGQLVEIIQQVQALTPRFDAVTEGMQSQSTGAQQISEALLQLTESAQQTVESLRLSNQTIDQLRDAASGMQNGIARFKI